VLALIAGAALLAMVTAAIVAFGAVRVRPLIITSSSRFAFFTTKFWFLLRID
jgi:hypothetical protein